MHYKVTFVHSKKIVLWTHLKTAQLALLELSNSAPLHTLCKEQRAMCTANISEQSDVQTFCPLGLF